MRKKTNVRIIQLLCPSRHCIMAVAFDPKESNEDAVLAEFKSQVDELMQGKEVNEHCDLCGVKRKDWKYEVGVTPFSTLDEAKPALQYLQRKQLETREAVERWRANSN